MGTATRVASPPSAHAAKSHKAREAVPVLPPASRILAFFT